MQNIFFLQRVLIFALHQVPYGFLSEKTVKETYEARLFQCEKKRFLVNANARNRNLFYKIWIIPTFWGGGGGHAMGRVSLFGPTEASSDLLLLETLQ